MVSRVSILKLVKIMFLAHFIETGHILGRNVYKMDLNIVTQFYMRFLSWLTLSKLFSTTIGNSSWSANSHGLYLYLSSFILYTLHSCIVRAYYTCKKITNSETMQFLCKTVEKARLCIVVYTIGLITCLSNVLMILLGGFI